MTILLEKVEMIAQEVVEFFNLYLSYMDCKLSDMPLWVFITTLVLVYTALHVKNSIMTALYVINRWALSMRKLLSKYTKMVFNKIQSARTLNTAE